MPNLIIGSRGSRLALWQSNWVKDRLEETYSGLVINIEIIKTTGDKLTEASLAQIGGKGVFTKEIEEALLDHRIDLAVHSLKDLPTALPRGLHIAAITEREDVRDALIVGEPLRVSVHSIGELPEGARVGTSSLRRASQLLNARPDLRILELRGNVETRLRKLDEGNYDAIILAAAGLNRLGFDYRVTAYLSTTEMLPAVGQGALGIEARVDDHRANLLLEVLNHPPTRFAAEAERAVLRNLGGGCAVPIAAFGHIKKNRISQKLIVDALVSDAEGRRVIRQQIGGPVQQAEELGAKLAEMLIEAGARDLLPGIGAQTPDAAQTVDGQPDVELVAESTPEASIMTPTEIGAANGPAPDAAPEAGTMNELGYEIASEFAQIMPTEVGTANEFEHGTANDFAPIVAPPEVETANIFEAVTMSEFEVGAISEFEGGDRREFEGGTLSGLEGGALGGYEGGIPLGQSPAESSAQSPVAAPLEGGAASYLAESLAPVVTLPESGAPNDNATPSEAWNPSDVMSPVEGWTPNDLATPPEGWTPNGQVEPLSSIESAHAVGTSNDLAPSPAFESGLLAPSPEVEIPIAFPTPVEAEISNHVSVSTSMLEYEAKAKPERFDPRLPMAGRRVIVTRAVKQSGDMTRALEAVGAEVIPCPTIEITEPSDWKQLDWALVHLSWYDWLAFTSANGVEYFLRRLDQLGHGRGELMTHRVCAVGRKTAEKLKSENISVDLMPERFTAEALVEEFINRYGVRQRLRGSTMLLPASRTTRDVIRPAMEKIGVYVEVVEAYQTVAPSANGANVARLFRDAEADYIIFTSPSTVTNMATILETDHLAPYLANTRVACIGPVTAEAARLHGLTVQIQPEEHTGQAIVDAIVADCFGQRPATVS